MTLHQSKLLGEKTHSNMPQHFKGIGIKTQHRKTTQQIYVCLMDSVLENASLLSILERNAANYRNFYFNHHTQTLPSLINTLF